jgi:hypothetical protein
MKDKYISLKEAAGYSSYSPDYLKLRARQGKLKALKMGRNWFTTKEWLEEYKNKLAGAPVLAKEGISLRRWLIVFLALFLTAAGVLFWLNFAQPLLEKIIPAKVIEVF